MARRLHGAAAKAHAKRLARMKRRGRSRRVSHRRARPIRARRHHYASASRPRVHYRTRYIKKVRHRRGLTKAARARAAGKRGLTAVLVGGGTALGLGIARYAGLQEAVPVQRYLGISLVGIVGIGFLIAGVVLGNPLAKDITITIGTMMVGSELIRQFEGGFVDFKQLPQAWQKQLPEQQPQGAITAGESDELEEMVRRSIYYANAA